MCLTYIGLEEYLGNQEVLSNFCSPLQLMSFGQKEGVVWLELVEVQGAMVLLQHDWRDKQHPVLRVLFDVGVDTNLRRSIVKQYSSTYAMISNNFLPASDIDEDIHSSAYREYILDVDEVLRIPVDKTKYRYQDYTRCLWRHPGLRVIDMDVLDTQVQRRLLEDFWYQWQHDLGFEPVLDKRMLTLYWNTGQGEMVGVVDAAADSTLVAYGFYSPHPALKSVVVGHINKCLRGYVGLGTFLKVESARAILERLPTVSKVLIGGEGTPSQKRFKDTFLDCGRVVSTKAEVLWRAKGLSREDIMERLHEVWVV